MAYNFETLDTNILLRFILNDIPEQRAKVIKLLSKPDTRYHVADLAISEMSYVLETQLKHPRILIVREVQQILSESNINCNRALFSEVLPFYLSHPKLSFADCCLSIYAALNQAEPLWTFDKKLALQSPTAKELN